MQELRRYQQHLRLIHLSLQSVYSGFRKQTIEFKRVFSNMINNIGDAGATSLSESLKVNSSLTELYLYVRKNTRKYVSSLLKGKNKIGDSGFTSFSGALKENSSLTQLYVGLSCCFIIFNGSVHVLG